MNIFIQQLLIAQVPESIFPLFNLIELILNQIAPALTQLATDYTYAFNEYVKGELNIARIWFSLVVVYLLFTFLVLWIPYMRRLRDDIWRTKGMLNMIPMEIINENENLTDLFISGELIKAVR